jgi:dTDP-4-amino-4,6-dideoxygalactose transaminase
MANKVPFVNYPLQYNNIKKEVLAKFEENFQKGDMIYRKDVQDFEKNIAKFSGAKYGIGTDSCTGAMFIALKALGIGPGDEVITVGHTYVATIDVIVNCGAKPVLIDVGPDYNMNPDLIEPAITKRTKAIMPVHLNGRACQMDKIMAIARKHKLYVVEDAAQALGVVYKGKKAGSFGNVGCISFYPAKMLGCYGEAGIALTSDKKLATKMYLLRDHGELPPYLDKSRTHKIYLWGFNTILDNIQAAVLNIKFKYFPGWIKRRREIAKRYISGLRDVKGITLPEFGAGDAFQNFVIRAKKRDGLFDYLKENGVETLVSWRTPNHKQKALKEINGFKLPFTETLSKEVLSLPMYPELTDGQVDYAIACVRAFYKS